MEGDGENKQISLTMSENVEGKEPFSVPIDEDHIGNDRAFKGDDSDGKVNWTIRTAIAALTLGMLYTGSQIVLYMIGGSLSYVEASLGAQGKGGWLTVSNTLAITAVAPFTGYLQDLVGRREITLFGSAVICVGIALVASAHAFGQAVAGMAIAGAGAGICELSALAGLSDIVPVKHRGFALALMIACILPFTPYVIYGQLISSRASWRWAIWMCLFYNAVVLIGLATTYFPKGHPRMEGVTKKKIMTRIDYIGAILSIVGLTILLVALQAGGYSHPWKSAYVLSQLIIGLVLVGAWVVWEWKFAKYPMIPRQIFQGQRVVALTFFIAFVAGINFYSLLNFYPLSFATMYDPDPIQIGLKGLGYGISITAGAVFFNALLSTSIEAKWILLVAASLMSKYPFPMHNLEVILTLHSGVWRRPHRRDTRHSQYGGGSRHDRRFRSGRHPRSSCDRCHDRGARQSPSHYCCALAVDSHTRWLHRLHNIPRDIHQQDKNKSPSYSVSVCD